MWVETFASGSKVQQWQIGDRFKMSSEFGYLPFTGTVIPKPSDKRDVLGVRIRMDSGEETWAWPHEMEEI